MKRDFGNQTVLSEPSIRTKTCWCDWKICWELLVMLNSSFFFLNWMFYGNTEWVIGYTFLIWSRFGRRETNVGKKSWVTNEWRWVFLCVLSQEVIYVWICMNHESISYDSVFTDTADGQIKFILFFVLEFCHFCNFHNIPTSFKTSRS